jgi:hypothetical protein
MKRKPKNFRAVRRGLLLSTLTLAHTAWSVPVAIVDLHGYRPNSSSVMVPVRPLAEWLGVRLTLRADSVLLTSGEKMVVIEKDKPRILINREARPLSSSLLVKDGQQLVPLREVAEAFGARAIYRSGGTANSAARANRDGVVLQQVKRQLWVPIYESSPARMTRGLRDLDAVVPGTYGED